MSSKTPVSLQSTQLFQRALNVIPGGVNSPVRAFGAVGSVPALFKKQAAREAFEVVAKS